MATKLKNISRNRLTKIIAFALSMLMVWLAISDLGDFLYENKAKDISLMAESLFADSYYETSRAHSRIYNAAHFLLAKANDDIISSSMPDEFTMLGFAIVDENGNTMLTSDEGMDIDQFREGNFIVYSEGTITEVGGKIPESIIGAFRYRSGCEAVISFPDSYWGDGFAEFSYYSSTVRNLVGREFNRLIVFLVCVIYLIMVSGRKPEDNLVHTIFPDNIWTEVHIFGLYILVTMAFIAMSEMSYAYSPYVVKSSYNFGKFLICLAAECIYCGFIWIFLSLVRKIKARKLLKGTCIYWCWCKLKAVFKAVSEFCGEFIRNFTGVEFKDVHFAAGFHKIQVRFVALSVLMFVAFCFSVFFALAIWNMQFFWVLMCIAIVILEAFFIWHYIKKTTRYSQSMARLLVQIDKVSSGDLDYYAGIDDGDPLVDSSDKLANISEGLSEALEEQMKGERMKIELITNVSHDLKTPLTSIISYIDLLKKEEMNDVAKDYVGILAQKADRLKGIVSDLFDLAKTNSGNAQLDIKPLDFTKLTNQLLADMEDKIKASDAKLKINLAPSPVVIRADGKKLSRALQNVVDNALKYSLAGSRIYIDLIKTEENAVLSVKNTSAFEMDFTADEIMQRFVRGDKNRSTEGTGLGLSIAQSFTQVSGGSFDVAIDGDQFKTVFTFPVYADEVITSSEGII
ncbi:MAG: HAMP domain-containing histidine kinase [Clostridia bacterium]|nr:HAMP domain-containing histidine kinase [Clostridia bacterium]